MKQDDFMESIFGCMERIEDMIKGLSNTQTVNNNTEVDNSINIALLQEIKVLVENATGANCKYTERKIQELSKTLGENLRVINDNVKRVSCDNKPEFESIQSEFESLKLLLASLTVKIAEAKVTHRKNDYNINLNFTSRLDWIVLIFVVITIAGLASAYYFESRQNKVEADNSLKYRYIKMKGEATPKQISELEDIFELNRDNAKIKQMREDVEAYEDAVRKQAALAEQVRLKEQEATELDNKAKSIKGKLIETDKTNK